MADNKTDIWVYADWEGFKEPTCIGILSAHQAKGKKAFSFDYDKHWIASKPQMLLDPEIQWYSGTQYAKAENFGVFMDSMPDNWGQKLMIRRAAQAAAEKKEANRTLYEIDFLLGVNDETRMGALRFKTDPNGAFENSNLLQPTPPLYKIRELQDAAEAIESDASNEAVKEWLAMLIAPGSSLGGARPKANIRDTDGTLMIAKFPSRSDNIDKAAWEYLAHLLALKAEIFMSNCRIENITGKFHTFFTNRFDRQGESRIHFASAMTMTGNNEQSLKVNPGSYLEIAEFIQYHGANPKADLNQLWRRIVFNMVISNTDDHLRNHGFLLDNNGWRLSPAYDINPSIEKNGLALNVDMDNNAIDLDLAKSVGQYFQLNISDMDKITEEVINAAKDWKSLANKIGISKSEQDYMSAAFLKTAI